MNIFLVLAFLFFIGSLSGWVLELFYRRFTNPEKKWINPGFCTGPYLPIYGCGLCLLFLIASIEETDFIKNPILEKFVIFITMVLGMTLVEYIAGLISLRFSRVRLWDYSNEWGNIQGIICPKFSLIWAVLGALYYFFIHKRILSGLVWLSNNLAFSFFIGLFFGFFIIDVVNSAQLVSKLKKYAMENEVIVRYESIKTHIRRRNEEMRQKTHFFLPFRSDRPVTEYLKEMYDSFETKFRKKK